MEGFVRLIYNAEQLKMLVTTRFSKDEENIIGEQWAYALR